MAHVSLRDYVTDAASLYDVLAQLQARVQASIGYRMMATVALLAGGFLLPGSMGMASFCLAAVAGLAASAALMDYTARGVLMDVVTLHEVIRPPEDAAELLAYQLAQTFVMPDESPEASGVPVTESAPEGTIPNG